MQTDFCYQLHINRDVLNEGAAQPLQLAFFNGCFSALLVKLLTNIFLKNKIFIKLQTIFEHKIRSSCLISRVKFQKKSHTKFSSNKNYSILFEGSRVLCEGSSL